MTEISPLAERNLRQHDIVPPDKLVKVAATVVGVGAIGRQVALQLAAMGVPQLQLIDPDEIEAPNLGCQGYFEKDLGRLKVAATADLCRTLNSSVIVNPQPCRFRRSMDVGNVVFCCVDSIETRKLIWESVRGRADFYIDGRMSAEVLRVLVAADAASRKHYPRTLFRARDAYRGACTAKSTIYCANVAAGLMLSQFTRWLRCLPVDADLSFNLLTSELEVSSVCGK